MSRQHVEFAFECSQDADRDERRARLNLREYYERGIRLARFLLRDLRLLPRLPDEHSSVYARLRSSRLFLSTCALNRAANAQEVRRRFQRRTQMFEGIKRDMLFVKFVVEKRIN